MGVGEEKRKEGKWERKEVGSVLCVSDVVFP